MPTRRAALAAGLALLGGPVLAGCGGSDKATGDKGYVDGDGVITVLPRAKRSAPRDPVSGTTLQGERLALSSYVGKPVVVNIWASWCPPCRKESPVLVSAAKQLGDTTQFVGINVRDPGSRDRALAYERRFDIPYPSLYDPSGRSLLGFRGKVTPYTIPSTLVLDSQGRVAASILGGVPSATTLVDLVQDAQKGVRTGV